MKLPYSILISVFALSVAFPVFSSQKMQDGVSMGIFIDWQSSGVHEFYFDGAIYPEEYRGLPVTSVQLDEEDVNSFNITRITRKAISVSQLEYLQTNLPQNWDIISLKKRRERSNEVAYLIIFPFEYDSLTDTYFQIEFLELDLLKDPQRISSNHLRKQADESNSVLSTGEWYKIPVLKSGVHSIDYNYLQNAGVKVNAIDPMNIRIYGNGGGMLPQSNSEERPVDLQENAISIVGETDGKFDRDDFILFFAEGADKVVLLPDGTLEYEKNYYSDTSFYFLTIDVDKGLRISDKEDLGSDHPKITHFDDYIVYENDEFNIINSGREWYGEKFDFTLTYDFKFEFPNLVPDTELNVTSAIMGQTYQDASMDLFVNGIALGQQPVYSITEGTYVAKGSDQLASFQINTTSIPENDPFTLRMSFNPAGSGRSRASLNYLVILGKRQLNLYGNQTSFRAPQSTESAFSTYEIGAAGSAYRIWDISDRLRPYNQKFSQTGDLARFGAINDDLNEYVIFRDNDYFAPEPASKIQNQNLRGSKAVDLLIVSYPAFADEANRLADLRRNHDGLRVLVATTQEIYNEFSSGKQDVTAIRDFIRYLYNQGEGDEKLQNVLLFGKGSFDYKNRIDDNTNFVPVYTSRNSLHPISSYSSDDYYGFLDEDEGIWTESYDGDHLMDIGVGRLPVKSVEEARIVVDKLIHYAKGKATFGQWRNELFFIADDGDGNLHQRDADRLTVQVDTSYTQFNVNKIYVDAFEQTESSIGEVAPGVNAEIERSMEKGGLIFNFTGHGSSTRWTSETILNISSAIEFENKDRFPLFVTATCEFGRHDNPKAISGAEYLLLNPKGGAIALLTTSRPVYSSTNFILNTRFYHNVFVKEEGRYLSMGEIFRRTKNQSLNGSVNRNFALLGDPSMTLAYAKDDIVLLAYEDVYQPGDTLSALSTVKLRGQVLDQNGALNSSFNGVVSAKVFDKPSKITTFGHEDAPMTFEVRDNLIFNGQATVAEGNFELEFIVPKNITFNFEKGKISLYAFDPQQMLDAAGADIEFVVGGENDDYLSDNTPPEISMYINDTSFVDGGIAGQDLVLLARLSDESGISLSKSDDGYDITARIDDENEQTVSSYYISAPNTYKVGWVTYPYKNLSTGIHKIRLKASDVHNNTNEAEIEFLIIDDSDLTIEKLINYPNPFSDYTTFSFEHNRAGDDLEILIEVFSMQGSMLKQFVYTKENSESRISDIFWDGRDQNGSNILGGVYVFRVSVRSLSDGSKKQANKKLVIIN